MSITVRRTMLARILAVIGGAPPAAVLFASACGGEVDRSADAGRPSWRRDTGTVDEVAPAPFPTGTQPPPSTNPPRTAPVDCPQPLEVRPPSTCAHDAGPWGRDVCFPLPEAGTCESAYREECILWGYNCGLIRVGDSVECRSPAEDACCWRVNGGCAVGRPFTVAGEAVVARVVTNDAWSDADLAAAMRMRADATDDRTRRALADVWEREALAEHASVASFARFTLELLALGAPADLCAAAQRAMGDEIEHARRCFALSSAYAGSARGPSALDVNGALGDIDLADFAARTTAEGCIAETIAALQLVAAADASSDPTLSAMLRTTADEESDHALLAWRTVRWALENGGTRVRSAVAGVFARASAHVGFGPCASEDVDPRILQEHGVLSRRERHDLALAALESVIAPAAEELISERAEANSRPRAHAT